VSDNFIGPPCPCIPCEQAGVSTKPQVRDRHTGQWLHGAQLRRWHEAREKFFTEARKAVGARGRHAAGFEKLVNPS
jgi:hypothetical protein